MPDIKTVIHNAAQILTMNDASVGLWEHGVVVCEGRTIQGIYEADSRDAKTHLAHARADGQLIDAQGGLVTPGLIDPHTHPIFAGQRCVEFGLKAAGKTYLEIQQAGGGILSTVAATQQATDAQLADTCRRNLSRLLRFGVTTCEAKSGYALDPEGELRLLKILRQVSAQQPVEVIPTVLAAHALPSQFNKHRQAFISQIIDQLLPQVAADHLAHYCDAFCETGAFTVEEVAQIFTAAKSLGLGLRLHAEQFTNLGGAKMAAQLGAASADHLEMIDDDAIDAMARAKTTAVLLPGAALTCRCPWPPAKKLLEANVPVALGTDLNPGSSMTASLPLMMTLACTQMQMTCEQAWRAVTCVAADSLGRSDLGRIAPGLPADVVIFDAPDYRYIPYHFGENHARIVIKNGTVVVVAAQN